MPVEIRELIIKATVIQDGMGTSAGGASSGAGNSQSSDEKMIATCVEKVMEILKDKNGR